MLRSMLQIFVFVLAAAVIVGTFGLAQARLEADPPVQWPWVVLGISAGIAIWIAPFFAASAVGGWFDGRDRVREQQRLAEQERVRRERAEQVRVSAERDRVAAEQRHLIETMDRLVSASVTAFETLPRELASAEQALDAAEVAFQERAFAPFWDAVERSAQHIGHFDASVRQITIAATKHAEIAPRLARNVPPFPISTEAVDALQVGSHTVVRLRSVTSVAQRDFQFATIYEQRRTNQILIAGFTSLGSALSGLGNRIEQSLEAVREAVNDMHSGLRASVSALEDSISEVADRASQDRRAVIDAVLEHDSEQTEGLTERCDQALVMLDNLQRGRRPLL